MTNIIEIVVTGKNQLQPVLDETKKQAKTSGEDAGKNFTDGMGEQVKKDLPAKVEDPVEESGKRSGTKGGNAAGKSFAASASPLMLGAFATIATLGPTAIIGAAAVAVAGISALVAKGNAQVADEFQGLGSDISSTLQNAVAPFASDVSKSIQILDSGLSVAGPQLRQVFAAAAPYSEDMAKSLVAIVTQALPGIAAGMREIQPIMQGLDQVAGSLGRAIGGFIQQLGTGSGGAAVGFEALGAALAHILPDLGQIIGALSSGLGPALSDILGVVTPLVGGLAGIVSAFPPGMIEAAAVATTALFAAFKVGLLMGVVEEGATFVAFLGTAVTAEGAAALATDTLAVSAKGLGAAIDIATGPVGILAAAATGLYFAIKNSGGTSGAMNDLIEKAKQYAAQQKQLAADTKASADAVSHQAAVSDDLTIALNTAAGAASASAQKSAVNTLASIGLTKGTSGLTDGLYTALTAYSAATGAAGGYNSILQALNGTTASLDDAQNSMAQQLLTLKTSFKANKDSMDLNTQAGINNRQALSTAAAAAVKLATSQYQATGDMNKANQTLQQQENQILNNIGVTGTLREKVKAYLDQIMQIPKGTITTNLDVNTAPAIAHVKNVISWIDGQSASFYVNSTGPGARAAQPGLAHGGVVGADGGGPRGGWTLVGEQGPELVSLPFGSTVHSNPDTQRMLSGGQSAGGVGRVELTITGADREFLTFIRKIVRTVGGGGPDSVQRALGQSF